MSAKNKRASLGFTLAELLVTVIIIGVLATLAVPRFNYAIERMRSAEGISILQSLLSAQKAYYTEYGTYSDSYSSLDVEIPEPDNFRPIGNSSVSSSNPIATVERSTGDYTLMINDDGTIECTNNSSGDSCEKIGY